jgi:TatD DNase family protein
MSGGTIMRIIDTHAHLDEMEKLELELALDKARKAGIEAIIAVGSNSSSNQKVLEICQTYPFFAYPALGLHPWELGDLNASQIDDTLKLIEEKISNIIAIGEIGLDYDKRATKKASKESQKEVLKRLLALAKKHNKPVSIHSRYAWKDCFDIVHSTGIKKAVFHWFTGFSTVLKDIVDAGYFISCTPAAEYHEEHRRVIKETPAEQLLLETDCPVVYGREDRYRSQPSDVLRSLKYTALLKGISEPAIAEQTTFNARQIFDIKLPIHVK